MNWIAFPDSRLEVNGLPWFAENSPELWRLPSRLHARVRDPVWRLATMPAGARLRFRTDSTVVAVRADYPESAAHGNMSLIGQMGIDLYSDGRHRRSVCPGPISGPNHGLFEQTITETASRRWRDVVLYLPNYAPISLCAIGLDDEASIEAPSPFSVSGPVVFYGSSITQGGCASRPGMSYQAILSRTLNTDFVNLGFSGNGLGDVEIAEAMAEIDASCYVLDYGVNLSDPDTLIDNYPRFIETIRRTRPDTPLICITPIYATPEAWGDDNRLYRMRAHIRQAVARRVAEGDPLRLIEGYTILGPDTADGFADGLHPNDLGFAVMARNLAPTIAEMIGLVRDGTPALR